MYRIYAGLLCFCAALTISAGSAGALQDDIHHLGVRKAEAVAARFFCKGSHIRLHPAKGDTSQFKWTTGKSYSFEAPLDFKNPKLKGKYKAVVSIQAETNRVVNYYVAGDESYEDATGYNRRQNKSKMLGKSKTLSIALGILKKAGVSTSDLHAEPPQLYDYEHWQGCYAYVYKVRFVKRTVQPGIGEVELPMFADIELNAITGELLEYHLYDQPLRIRLLPPRVTKAQAIKIVRSELQESGQVKLYGEFGRADAKLVAGLIPGDRPESKQLLYWRVTVWRKQSAGFEVTEMIDAGTGKPIRLILPNGK